MRHWIGLQIVTSSGLTEVDSYMYERPVVCQAEGARVHDTRYIAGDRTKRPNRHDHSVVRRVDKTKVSSLIYYC